MLVLNFFKVIFKKWWKPQEHLQHSSNTLALSLFKFRPKASRYPKSSLSLQTVKQIYFRHFQATKFHFVNKLWAHSLRNFLEMHRLQTLIYWLIFFVLLLSSSLSYLTLHCHWKDFFKLNCKFANCFRYNISCVHNNVQQTCISIVFKCQQMNTDRI